jgi:hypothetical protein
VNTADHAGVALDVLWGLVKELEDAGARAELRNIAVYAYNRLVDFSVDPDPDPEPIRDLYAQSQGVKGPTKAVWDTVQSALNPLVTHINYVESPGEDDE